ncbi:HAD family hydrolase [Pararobbsia silviterrae]|uniref:HAD family phosphatase n=1 Tax=Pararobbsia silviterrae TaxID=1792498 RepID=A0A494XUY7_9BURK|nr:HAD family phosphatase [Pararobbsia silviterrae]RKP51879.1 HAD family phosphatase [Pararobbsia silviterrae]
MTSIPFTNVGAIFWDMDGTLADSEPLHLRSLIDALAHHGIEADETLHPLILGKTGREVHALCRERFGIRVDYAEWARFRARCYLVASRSLVPREGALDVYGAAREAGLRQAIVSNASRMLLEANLRALGIEDPQLVSVSVNDVRRGKPDPEPYVRAAWLLGVDAREVVVVEDSPTGVQAAVAAGMRVIAWAPDGTDAASFDASAHVVYSAAALAHALGLDIRSRESTSLRRL